MRKLLAVSFFTRMLIVSCIIGIIPILLLGYLSYHKSYSTLKEELTASNKLILQQNKVKVESVLKTVDTLTTQTLITPVTTNAISMQTVLDLPFDYKNHDLFEKLLYSLVQIQVYELGIVDVKLISYREDWLIDNGAVYIMKNRVRIDKHDDFLFKTYNELKSAAIPGKYSYWKLDQNSSGKYVMKLNKNIPLNSSKPYGLISVHIPLSEINKQLSGDTNIGSTFVVNVNGQVISSLDSLDIGSSIINEGYFQTINSNNDLEGFFIDNIDGEELLIQYNKARYNDWIYISLTPVKDLMSKSDQIKVYTTICVAILMLVVGATAYLFSNQMSLPIRRIYHSIISHEDKKQYNELSFISEYLDKLTHTKGQLDEQVKRLHKQAQEFFVMKLLLGYKNLGNIKEQLEQLKLPGNWENWNVVSLQIDRNEERYSSQDLDLYLYAICNIIDETLDKEHTLPPIINNQFIHFFIGIPIESKITLKNLTYNHLVKLQNDIKKYLKLSVNIGISREHYDWLYTSLAYDESINALYYRSRLEDEPILRIEEAEPVDNSIFRYPKEIEQQLIDAIRITDEEKIKDNLNNLIVTICAYANNPHDYQHAMNRLFTNLAGMVQDAGESINTVLDLRRLPGFMLESSHSTDEKIDWFDSNLIRPLLLWSKNKIQKSEINISQFITLEIINHYDQDLSIEYFASLLNYHPSYISRVFKKDTGLTFSEYLSNYRIEKAKQMLRYSNMKIAEIAEKLKYSTASNFNRHFKKVVQLTPSQYRDSKNDD